MPDLDYLSKFIPSMELAALKEHLKGEEKEHFVDLLDDLEKTIKSMPGLYDEEAEKQGLDAPILLHYFFGGSDWWFSRYDPEDQVAFGFVRLGGMGDCAELGYSHIPEILRDVHHGPFQVELDLYWNKETTLREVMEKCDKDF